MTVEPRTLPDTEPAAANRIADHLDHFFRTVFTVEDALLTPICFRYVTGEPHPLGNLALIARAATAEDVTRDVAPLAETDLPTAVVFLDEGTPAQHAAVTALGYTPAESMPVMSVTPDTLAATTLPDGYTMREVTVEDAEAWAVAVADGYGLPRPVGAMFGVDKAAARCPGQARYFAAEHSGTMVATSVVYFHDGLAGIYCVATLPEHRGKGLAAHLTAEPLRGAWADGYTTGLLQASEMGAPVYARIGFRTHGHMALLARIPE